MRGAGVPLPSSRRPDAMAALIRARFPLRPVPGLPDEAGPLGEAGLRLHMAGPTSGLGRLAGGRAAPYWAFAWAGGLALARHLLADPAAVRGRAVLDLGAGSGLVGLVAARAGARRVVANEIDPHGVVATGLNAEANGASLSVEPRDLLDGEPPPGTEVVLVGDLFYEEALARRVTAFLDRCRAGGLQVLVGDPGRTALPLARLEPLDSFAVGDVGLGAGESAPAGVFGWRTSPRDGGGA